MDMKMYNLVWLFILQCLAVMKCHVDYVDDYQETTEGDYVRWASPSNSVARCTRRFTPGHCVAPLRPVWTYVYRTYRCTERLGCRARRRFNRFDSRESCELRCRNLIAGYIGRTGNHSVANAPSDNSRRRMYYAEEEKVKKYARDEKEEDDARQRDDGPLETEDDDDRYTPEIDIDSLDDDSE